LGFSLYESAITFDPAFDSEDDKVIIRWHNLIPVIKPNRRGIKDDERLEELYNDFDETTYKLRYKIERIFAWQDTYRKLVTRYETLNATHNGFKLLAYSLINLRELLENPI
jgi:hypothetical protein